MTKKIASSPIRHLLRFCSKLIIFLFVLVCLVAFPRLHSQSKPQTPVFTSQSRRTLRDHHVQFEGPPKIAFLFLVRRDLPLILSGMSSSRVVLRQMSPTIPKEKWRKGSQWITLIRRHAEIVADDAIIFPVFREFCKDFDSRFTFPWLKLKHQSCISDEHYVQALLAMSGLEEELERRTLTYTSWNHSATRRDTRSWHPLTFDYADADPQKIREIKDINHVYYESSNRTERCQISSKPAPCYFFARKFTHRAGICLLNADWLVLMAFMHCENSHT